MDCFARFLYFSLPIDDVIVSSEYEELLKTFPKTSAYKL